MAMPRAVRHINETRALEALFRAGPMSRAELARALGVTRSTAGSIVAALIEAGALTETACEGTAPRGRTGRPGARVCLRGAHALFLGTDIGIGHGTVTALDLAGRVVALESFALPGPRPAPAEVADIVAGELRALVAGLADPAALRGVNLTVPGLVDLEGRVIRAPFLGWSNVPVRELVQARLPGLAVVGVENDANAFAFAARDLGGQAAPREAVYLFLDAGVGGCVVSGGAVVRGHRGYAGELGGMVIGDRGYAAEAAVPGSLESFVGAAAVLARLRAHGGEAQSIEALLGSLARGDSAARATLADWAHHLGRGLASLVALLNPEQIVLGGPLAPLYEAGRDAVANSLRAHLLPASFAPEIRLTGLGPEAPALGAALMLHRASFAYDEALLFGAR